MEHDVRVTHVALELHEHEIIPREAHAAEVNGYFFATLRTAHLLANPLDDLMERVGIEFHDNMVAFHRTLNEHFSQKSLH